MKTVLIVGGTRGLGLAMGKAFQQAGWSIVVTWQEDGVSARQAADCLGAGATILQADSRDSRAAEKVTKLQTIQASSQLVYIHNAAAVFEPKPLHLQGWPDYLLQMEVGLRSLIHFTGLLLPLMTRHKYGRVVPVLTRAVHSPIAKGMAAYLTNKAAMGEFSRCLDTEYRGRGIRSFCVEPGYMESKFTRSWPEMIRKKAGEGPISRPDRLAQEVLKRCLDIRAEEEASPLRD